MKQKEIWLWNPAVLKISCRKSRIVNVGESDSRPTPNAWVLMISRMATLLRFLGEKAPSNTNMRQIIKNLYHLYLTLIFVIWVFFHSLNSLLNFQERSVPQYLKTNWLEIRSKNDQFSSLFNWDALKLITYMSLYPLVNIFTIYLYHICQYL